MPIMYRHPFGAGTKRWQKAETECEHENRKHLEVWKLDVRGPVNCDNYQMAHYLQAVASKTSRQRLAQIRMGSHMLGVETGRWQRLPRAERLCQRCSCSAVDDEGRKEGSLHTCPDKASWLMQGLQRERHAQTKNQTETKTETENKTTKQMTHNVQTPIWCWQITMAKNRNRKHLEMHVPQHPREKPQAQVPVKSPRRPCRDRRCRSTQVSA